MQKAGRFELSPVRAALLEQARVVEQLVAALPDDAFALPTRLGEWTVGMLVAHLSVALAALERWSAAPEPSSADLTYLTYYDAGRPSAALVDAVARDAAADREPAALRAMLNASVQSMSAAAAGLRDGQVVATRIGAVTAADCLVTRCIEVVVHGLDLQAATGVPHHAEAAVTRSALAVVVKVISAILQERAPGHSVEMRIPGPAGTAFQCGEGPQHTRGTPPNVVETDAVTFVELGAGRLDWAVATASGRVRASGARADLSALLPALG